MALLIVIDNTSYRKFWNRLDLEKIFSAHFIKTRQIISDADFELKSIGEDRNVFYIFFKTFERTDREQFCTEEHNESEHDCMY